MSKTSLVLITGGGLCWLLQNILQCPGHPHNKELCDPRCQWGQPQHAAQCHLCGCWVRAPGQATGWLGHAVCPCHAAPGARAE